MIMHDEARRIREFKAPEEYRKLPTGVRVFLAGSINMGEASHWQAKFVQDITADMKMASVDLINPRRDDWDPSWEQSIGNTQFYEQVDWELEALETSRIIAMYFDAKGHSPITLLELGLHTKQTERPSRLIVCCEDGFWRQGNVEITCAKYGIPYFNTYEPWLAEVQAQILYQYGLQLVRDEALRAGRP